jgi:hypothetical protein
LEAISLKALSPRIEDRYTTALDFARALRKWVSSAAAAQHSPATSRGTEPVVVSVRVIALVVMAAVTLAALWYAHLLPRPSEQSTPPLPQPPQSPPARSALLREAPVELLSASATNVEHDSVGETLQIRAADRSSFFGIGQASSDYYEIEATLQIEPLENANGPAEAFVVFGATSSLSADGQPPKWTGKALQLRTGWGTHPPQLKICQVTIEKPAAGPEEIAVPQIELGIVPIILQTGQASRLKWSVGPNGLRQVWWDGKPIVELWNVGDRPRAAPAPLIGRQLGVMVQGGSLLFGQCTMKPLAGE